MHKLRDDEKAMEGNGLQEDASSIPKKPLFHIFDVFTMTLTKHLHP
jgi:hypothetical protein